MTYQESRERLAQLADHLGGDDAPVFFSDRAFRKPLSKPVGTVADYLEQLSKKPANDVATSVAASGTACPLLDVVLDHAEDGRDCVVFEYNSVEPRKAT